MFKPYIKSTKEGRRFVISDIHGCLATFKALLNEKIQLKPEDQLILLGDYVHRGPDSKGVLDLILDLMDKGYQIYPLRGNHEVMYLEENELIFDQGRNVPANHRKFLENLPYYYETVDYYFAHAGFNFIAENPLDDTFSMLWGTRHPTEPDLEFLNGRKLIFGHVKHDLSTIFDAIYDNDPVVPLDNGCYKGIGKEVEGMGNLCAIDLNRWELIVQKNVERVGE